MRQAEKAVDAVGSVVAGSTKEVKAAGETCLLILAHTMYILTIRLLNTVLYSITLGVAIIVARNTGHGKI